MLGCLFRGTGLILCHDSTFGRFCLGWKPLEGFCILPWIWADTWSAILRLVQFPDLDYQNPTLKSYIGYVPDIPIYIYENIIIMIISIYTYYILYNIHYIIYNMYIYIYMVPAGGRQPPPNGIPPGIPPCIHTYRPTYLHTYVCTYVHTYIHRYINTYTHTHIHTCMHTYIQTYIHT